MRFVDASAIDAALAYPHLVDVLEKAFREGAISPPRHHHQVPLAGRPEATWLLMPAFSTSAPGSATAGAFMGMKSVTVFPDNGQRHGKPAVCGTYLLLSAETGETVSIMDATRLTLWRTAAASALAARYLARPEAASLLMVGAGALAPYLVRAHASVRPIRRVRVWNRSRAGAERVVAALSGQFADIAVAGDLESEARQADVISTATFSSEPLVLGKWLRPGTHVDSVGAFRKSMRETDDELVRRARVFVDTREGAFGEAGDLLQPIDAGVIDKSHILADLYDLTRGSNKGRVGAEEITFFKSVGASIEDLAAAIAVHQRQQVA
jgi:ornithine cyclodeaminase